LRLEFLDEIGMLIDSHAHVNFNAYKDDSDEVIRRALDSGVWMINVGSQYTTSERAVMMAEKYSEGVYAAIGLHPIHLETGLVKIKADKEEIEFKTWEEEFDYEKYKKLALSSKKVVAIGEIGLDYYYRPKTKTKQAKFKEKQKQVFIRQFELAQELNLPVILHCRMTHQELLEILYQEVRPPDIKQFLGGRTSNSLRGVAHCFTGNLKDAEEYIQMGFYLGFNGIIFKKAEGLPDFEEIIKEIPLEKILVETDCPYLTPPISVNQRSYQREGSGSDRSASMARNEPLYVKYVAEEIAKIKNISYEEVENKTTQNAKTLFKI